MKIRNLTARASVAAALLTLLVPTTAFADDEDDAGGGPHRVTIVSSLPLASSQFAAPIQHAIQMAIDDAGGRVRGVRIDYKSLDDGTSAGGWPGEIANAQLAVADPSVVAYLGPFNSSAARHSIPILCTAGLGMVSPTNTNPGLTVALPTDLPGEPGIYYPNGCARNYSRNIARDDVVGEVAAARALALGAHRAFVIQASPNDTAGYGFVAEAARIGLAVVGTAQIQSDPPPFAATTAAITASSADFVYYSCFAPQPACSRVVQAVQAAVPSARMMITDAGFQIFQPPNPFPADGLLDVREFVAPANYPPAAAAWYARFSAIYGAVPGDEFNGAIYAYDATRVVLAAIAGSRAHLDRASVRAAIMSTANFPGLLGTFSFDANGDTTASLLSVAEVVNGAWVDTGTASLP